MQPTTSARELETDLRAALHAADECVNVADARFNAICAEMWTVPALSARAEELRIERDAALAETRVARAHRADLRKRGARY